MTENIAQLNNKKHLAYQLHHYVQEIIDLFYPPRCVNCGKIGESICISCLERIERINPSTCHICGTTINPTNKCCRCSDNIDGINGIFSLGIYKGVLKKAVIAIKYARNRNLAHKLIPLLSSLPCCQQWSIDLVVPIPTSANRKRARGYNQAEWIAKEFCLSNNLQFKPQALYKIKDTRSQVGLSIKERVINVKDAFCALNELVSSKKVLIIDDVITTGATLHSAAKVLKSAGAKMVYGLTIAHAVTIQDHQNI